MIVVIIYNNISAQISIVSLVPVNRTAVRVIWTPLNELVVEYYTVHYNSLERADNVSSRTFPVSASSGVVSGLQEGQWYQFSVSATLINDGQMYNSTPGELKHVMTGRHVTCIMLTLPRGF